MTTCSFIGHESIRDRLTQALEKKVIPEAFLFYGQQGVGKTTLAQAFGYAVVSESAFLDPSLKKHIDLTTIDLEEQAQAHTIQTVRLIKELVYIPPLVGKKRVILIKDAHKMQIAASHALLKCLEEPSSSTVFILIAPSLMKILPTIASRCCKIPFHPLKEQQLYDFLSKEKNVPSEKARQISKISFGSLAQAMSHLGGVDEDWKNATLKLVTCFPFLSSTEFAESLTIIEKSLEEDKTSFFDRFFDYLNIVLKDLLTLHVGYGKENLFLVSSLDMYQKTLPYFNLSSEKTLKALEDFHDAFYLHVKMKVALENFLFCLYL